MTLTLVASGTRPWSSAWRRSGMLGNMVVPPDITTLPRRSFRTSRSQSLTVFLVSSWRPIISLPSRDGRNMSSGQRIIWLCTVTTVPSGISNCFSLPWKACLLGEVHGAVTEVLLDLLGTLALGSGGQGNLRFLENLADVVGEVTTGKVDALDGVRHGVPLVDWDSVRHTITTIHDDTSGTARGVEREHSLDGNVESASSEGLEHDLCHALAVLLGVHWSLGEQDTGAILIALVLIADNHAKLVVESVAPDLLHVLPVLHDTVLEGVLQDEDTTLLLSLLADVVVLVGTDQSSLLLGVTHDGGEGDLGCILAGAASLHHAGTVVHDNGGFLLIIIHHSCWLGYPH